MENTASNSQGHVQDIGGMNQLKDHNWKEEHTKLIESTKKKFWHVLLRFSLILHNYDPFYIFKMEDGQLKGNLFRRVEAGMLEEGGNAKEFNSGPQAHEFRLNDLYASNELKMRHSKWDRLRDRFGVLLSIFSSYFYLKVLLICTVQHSLLRYQYLVPKNKPKPLLSLETCQWLAETFGNPLYLLKDTSLLLYSGPSGFVILCAIILPAYYKRRPMNIAPLRFLLNPYHELRRIDASIHNKMAAVKGSFAMYRQEQRHRHELARPFSLGASSNFIDARHQYVRTASSDPPSDSRLLKPGRRSKPNQETNKRYSEPKEKRPLMIERSAVLVRKLGEQRLGKLERREEAYYLWLTRQLDEFSSTWKLRGLRPVTFGPEYFIKTSNKMAAAVWAAFALYSVCCVVISTTFWYPAYSDRCKSLDCNPLDVFSAGETLLLFEMLFFIVFSVFSSTLNLVSFSLLANNQLDLIEYVKTELLSCRDTITAYNERCRVTITKCGNDLADNEPETSYESVALERQELEKSLLRTLFKLMICDEELKDNSRSIALETLHSFFYAGACIFLTVTNGQFKLAETSFVRSFILSVSWFTFNSTVAACAYIHARMLEFGRILWTILAANALVFNECYRPIEGSRADRVDQTDSERKDRETEGGHDSRRSGQLIDRLVGARMNKDQLKGRRCRAPMARNHQRRPNCKWCTFVSDMWTRFVYSTSSNAERHCSRLFNVELNYQTIIEMNFFVIFVYSFTMLDK